MKPSCLACSIAVALAIPVAHATDLEELVVTARRDTRAIDVADTLNIAPDVAQLLKEAPGANVNSNGPLTGIPQYRGMFGQRIATSVDGSQMAPSCPNWMDPPISYVGGSQLETLEVYRGSAPVSVAQESIGGAIEARRDRGSFTEAEQFSYRGKLVGSAQSVNGGYDVNAGFYAGNAHHRVLLNGLFEHGEAADFPGGRIIPTEYERGSYGVGYGYRTGSHTMQLDYTYNDTGNSGTPALPMDIHYNRGDLYSLDYRFEPGTSTRAKLALYGNNLNHSMNNYELRQAPAPGNWRRNDASSDSYGFKLQVDLDDTGNAWIVGIDGLSSKHNSDIDNPNNAAFFLVNFNAAEREVLGAFLEWHRDIGERWRTELGGRYNHVVTDAGRVDGTPAMMGPGMTLRNQFNDADRSQVDHNVDLTAKTWYQLVDNLDLYAGVARKTRSPSYQERYLWLPLEAAAGLADGNTYTGVVDLDPETSRQVELGLDFRSGTLTVSPRLYYSKIDDYIQGTPSHDPAAIMFVAMMNGVNGTDNPPPLQFNNVEATIWGFDMDWAWQWDDNWRLSGILNYVRGERDDIHDNLYRIAAPNATFRLEYTAESWAAGVENVLYAEQDRVSETNREPSSSGYGLVNVNATWRATGALQLSAGVDNLLDKRYRDHLGGYNRAANPDIAVGERLPGYGINTFARVTYRF